MICIGGANGFCTTPEGWMAFMVFCCWCGICLALARSKIPW